MYGHCILKHNIYICSRMSPCELYKGIQPSPCYIINKMAAPCVNREHRYIINASNIVVCSDDLYVSYGLCLNM